MKKKDIILISSLILLIDLISKWLVSQRMLIDETITIIGKFFRITYTQNTGAAFSTFIGQQSLLIIISIVVIITLIIYLCQNKITIKEDIIGYGLLLGGTLGNLLDRIRFGYVIDFLDFGLGNYRYPIFNIADIGIVIGVIIIIIGSLRRNS